MRAFLFVPVALVVALGLAAVDEKSGLRTWLSLREEREASRARIERLSAEVEALRSEIAGLEGDPFALERAIREDLELARPGEIVVRFGGPTRLGGR